MLGSAILEAPTGLACGYLLLSRFASAINEAVLGRLVHLRARVLGDSRKSMLSKVKKAKTAWSKQYV